MPETELVSLDAFLDMEPESSELSVSEIEIVEPAAPAADEVEFVMEDAASVEKVEAVLEAEPEPAPAFVGADDALAAMIAAYGEQPSVEAQAAFAEEEASNVVETAEVPIPEADASADTDDGLVVPAQSEESAVTEAALADEDYYGMSLDELEALTSPTDTAPATESVAEETVSEASPLAEEVAALEEVAAVRSHRRSCRRNSLCR